MRRSLRFGLLVCCLAWLAGASVVNVLADEPAQAKDAPGKETPAKDAADDAPAEPFDKVLADWKAVDTKLSSIVEQFRSAPAADREALRKKYLESVEAAKRVLPRLRKAAIAEYQAKPNADDEVVKILVGLLANDVRSDDYRPANDLAKLLIDKKATEDAIYLFAGLAAFSSDDFDTAEKYLKLAKEKGAIDPNAEGYLEQIEDFKAAWKKEQAIRKAEAKADDLPRVKLTTNKGVIVIELFENEAPGAVGNFVSLVEKGFYDGLTFHRVLPNFMAQGGCPTGDGTGGPGYKIPCECNQPNFRHHFWGTLSMAHAGANTGGSQFFLTFRPTPHLDGRHTAFGRVIEGGEVLHKLQRRDPQRNPAEPDKIEKAEVVRKRDHEYKPASPTKE